MSLVYDKLKWPDRPHYSGEIELLGEDEHGLWGFAPEGHPVYRGGELMFRTKAPAVYHFPSGERWWAQFFSLAPAGMQVYVDVCTPPRWDAARVWFVDLDIDVVRRATGEVVVLDEDEFEAHRVAYAYPDDICAAAHVARAEIEAMLRAPEDELFAQVTPWLRAVEGR